ncbi:MAG: type II toxin-antitoxin system Phd/YefM family antitoxin [Defluviicoccus sp.]|nr:type II toxin-antitoxin system Phd/YefM family antitoxin [Defluviicoccus sp.]
MKEIAARDAKNRFGQLLDAAQSAPVRVTRNGRAVGVMMSVQQYERLRGAAWERLTATMDALGEEASAKGLTQAGLEALLADEGRACRPRHQPPDRHRAAAGNPSS